jgi:hypothetical protein
VAGSPIIQGAACAENGSTAGFARTSVSHRERMADVFARVNGLAIGATRTADSSYPWRVSSWTPRIPRRGEMWQYTTNQPAETNATTLNLLHTETSTALFARAYTEEGVVVSQVNLKEISGWLHTKEKLVDRVLEDIRSDSRPKTGSPAQARASLPVYYVNCDVPVKDLADQAAPAVSVPAPPKAPTTLSASAAPVVHLASLEFSSTPAGADVYVDDHLVGKAPISFSTAPG